MPLVYLYLIPVGHSTYILPAHLAEWDPVLQSAPSTLLDSLRISTCKISELKEAVSIVNPIALARTPPVAIEKGKVKEWTDSARRVTATAPEVNEIEDLETKVRCVPNALLPPRSEPIALS